jgi:hypothetical protein
MNLIPISKREFDAMDGPRRLNESPVSTSHYKIDLGVRGGVFGVGCSSELSPPVIVEQPDCWIGVDCEIVVLEYGSGRIISLLALPSRFQFFSTFDDVNVVVCETDVFVFNKNRTLRTSESFGDIITKIERKEEMLAISTLSGDMINLRIQ